MKYIGKVTGSFKGESVFNGKYRQQPFTRIYFAIFLTINNKRIICAQTLCISIIFMLCNTDLTDYFTIGNSALFDMERIKKMFDILMTSSNRVANY